ncbi:uncharacterized protein N7515_004964 [Penicillium bovifimosum]|uniref:3-dehydrosphinganine reductase n=1 Tax=Penicillium bovifimosum TaxID=126998 RepID=A0A9W9H138_9EURO|nr:uncharacterized protein N7515_004964 [Penicillium bovifimosum]KAJ5135686.1 hypothetical protein N7515_004964 [Penicillium bovifimosum]
MDPRDLLARFHMPQLSSFQALDNYSTPVLGASALFCTIIAYTIAKMFGYGSRKNEFEVDGKTVVITGGSDGMGKAVALQLSAKGANVVVVARTVSKLQNAVEEMKASAVNSSKQKFHYISADLTDPAECERVIAEVTLWNSGAPPDVVWCCAGFSRPGFFVDVPIKEHRQQMDTLYWTAANTAHATLRSWLTPVSPNEQVKTPRRHLIFTCSTLAFVPIAGYSPYSPAKAAIRSLSDTLSQEIEMYNGAYSQRHSTNAPAADVKIHTIFPMGILSPGFDNEQKIKPELTKQLEEADKPQTPSDVAKISISALERGEYLITTMFIGHILKGTALGPSPRNSIIGDTLLSWLSNLVFLQVIPDLRGKAFKWGKKNGLPTPNPAS